MPFEKKSIADGSRLAESEVAGVATPSVARATTPAPAQTKSFARQALTVSFVLANVLFLALLAAIAIPGKVHPKTSVPFYVAAAIIEALFLWRYFAGGRKRSTCHIVIVAFLLLIVWETVLTDLKLTHPVLIPNPENVFAVFPARWEELLKNVTSSMILLAEGFITSLIAGNIIGLFVGWMPKVREAVYPIAHALAPVPAIVFAPYLVMLLPSFKAAAVAVIFLGIFWPTLLNTILRVESLDKHILDSARMMGLSTPTIDLPGPSAVSVPHGCDRVENTAADRHVDAGHGRDVRRHKRAWVLRHQLHELRELHERRRGHYHGRDRCHHFGLPGRASRSQDGEVELAW